MSWRRDSTHGISDCYNVSHAPAAVRPFTTQRLLSNVCLLKNFVTNAFINVFLKFLLERLLDLRSKFVAHYSLVYCLCLWFSRVYIWAIPAWPTMCCLADVRVPLKPLADEASSEKRGVESRDASSPVDRKLKHTQKPETGLSTTSAANHVTSSFVREHSVSVVATTTLLIQYFSSMHTEQRSVCRNPSLVATAYS